MRKQHFYGYDSEDRRIYRFNFLDDALTWLNSVTEQGVRVAIRSDDPRVRRELRRVERGETGWPVAVE